MTMTESTTNVAAEIGEVTITRDYDAPREVVFRAMLEPEQLTHFWGPTGMHTPLDKIVVEPWAGGRFETTMMPDDDPGAEGYPMRAVFIEIVEPERVVWSEPEFGMTTTTTYTDLGGGR
ncbi:MAG: SRPBCC domain-containing protein, partial [Actinobacteria bacterium]